MDWRIRAYANNRFIKSIHLTYFRIYLTLDTEQMHRAFHASGGRFREAAMREISNETKLRL
jgi:hypothetical protein